MQHTQLRMGVPGASLGHVGRGKDGGMQCKMGVCDMPIASLPRHLLAGFRIAGLQAPPGTCIPCSPAYQVR